jgi:hypothetical protein
MHKITLLATSDKMTPSIPGEKWFDVLVDGEWCYSKTYANHCTIRDWNNFEELIDNLTNLKREVGFELEVIR